MPRYARKTVAPHLAAIRMLCNFLVVRQGIPPSCRSPAEGVRGPRHSMTTGKTPAFTSPDVRALFNTMKGEKPADLRDRAMVAVQLYSFGRVSVVVNLDVDDYYQADRAHMLRLQEKGGNEHALPCVHMVEPSSRRCSRGWMGRDSSPSSIKEA